MKRFNAWLGSVCLIILSTNVFAGPTGTGVFGDKTYVYTMEGATLNNTGDYDWWYGCSPTSTGMMLGYYDRNGYNGDAYDHLVPGGTAETQTYSGTTGWSALVNNIIASPGHVSDFYSGGYNASGDDGPGPYHEFNCLADFMGTSQDSAGNSNGGTTFYFWEDGSIFTPLDSEGAGVRDQSGMYGMQEYLTYTGYQADILYNQLLPDTADDIWGITPNVDGFTLDQYKTEIDAGRPVMIHVQGHSMLGYGYVDGTDIINVYDTWSLGGGSMTWGENYAGRLQYGVTVLELASSGMPMVPIPGALSLAGLGFVFAGWIGRRMIIN